jgi:transcriptional regulator with XRE-family HTH domain
MGRQMNVIRFRLKDREMSAEPFHYKMSGLDDIYLLNGFKVHETSHGRGVSVEGADDLHKAIGRYLILNRKVLGPKDIRFLRKNMGFTQEDLGKCLGVTGQTVARYEKAQTEVPGPVDKLIRIFYGVYLVPEEIRGDAVQSFINTIKELDGLDETSDEPAYFGSSSDGWHKAIPADIAHCMA